jgi:hypothetical protein
MVVVGVGVGMCSPLPLFQENTSSLRASSEQSIWGNRMMGVISLSFWQRAFAKLSFILIPSKGLKYSPYYDGKNEIFR